MTVDGSAGKIVLKNNLGVRDTLHQGEFWESVCVAWSLCSLTGLIIFFWVVLQLRPPAGT